MFHLALNEMHVTVLCVMILMKWLILGKRHFSPTLV